MSTRLVSVVIPTRDRPGALARCLASLRGQRDVRLELVVVDDGSKDFGAVRRVAQYAEARVVRLDGRGPAAARNAGIRGAAGDVVLLTDDDCVAWPGWAAELARVADVGGGLAVGRTLHDRRRPLVSASEAIVGHAERCDRFAATRNVGLRRELALAVRFDERFRIAGGEDREWCRRLTGVGAPLVAAPRAVLFHDPELDVPGFLRQHARYGRGARVDPGWTRGPAAAYGRLLLDGFRNGLLAGSLVVVAQAATAIGYASRPAHAFDDLA